MRARTSTWRRAGTVALAVLAVASSGPLAGTAGANHTSPADTLVVTPSTVSVAVDSCVTFTVAATAGGRVAESTLVDAVTTEQPARGGTDVDFCGTTPLAQTDGGPAGSSDRAEYRAGSDGTFTFGVTASDTGTVGITIHADPNDDDQRQTSEPQDAVTVYVTSRNVSCVDARPEAGTSLAGEPVTTEVRITNNIDTDLRRGTSSGGGNISDSGTSGCDGDPIAGVTPRVQVSGANAGVAVSCTATSSAGLATCSYPGTRVGTDTLLVFVDEGGAAGKDSGEAGDTVVRTLTPAPSGLQVDLICASANRTGPEDCLEVLPSGSGAGTVQLVAQVTGPDGADTGSDRDPAVGIAVVFTENGGAATVTAECITDAAGRCTVTLTESTPVAGEVVAVTARVRGQDPAGDLGEDQTAASGERSSDTARVSWRNTVASARYVDLKPEGPFSTTAGQSREVTATVTDVNGSPVQGVQVSFSESGPGTFTGGATVAATTDASGVARATLTSAAADRGTQQVTATITTPNTQCAQAAGQGGSAQTPNPTAGSCADTEQNTLTGPSLSPSPSASPTPSVPAACSTPASLLAPSEISYGMAGEVLVRATPGRTVLLYAYTRPSTEYRAVRTGTVGPDGTITWAVRPPGNTRMYAQESGCQMSASVVTAVRSLASINARRLDVRLYTFYGSVQPRRTGQVVSLYRRTSTGGDVLTAQARTDANGVWTVTRRFTGSGRFGFLARTGNDLVNLGATSPIRPTVVY